MRYALLLPLVILTMAGTVLAEPAPVTRIGYVDLTRALTASQQREDMEAKISILRAGIQDKDTARRIRINKIASEAEQLAMGVPERQALEEKAREEYRQLEKWRQENYMELDREWVKIIETLFEAIMVEVKAVAEEGDFDLVIQHQSNDASARTRNEAVVQISQQIVLFAKPQYDLTDVVVQRLNETYAEAKKATPVTAPEQDAAEVKET